MPSVIMRTAPGNSATPSRIRRTLRPWRCFLYIIMCAACLTACAPSGVQADGDTMRYARLLRLEHADSVVTATVLDPWHEGRVLQRYALVPRGRMLPAGLPADATVVNVPLRRAVSFTAVHAALLCDLGAAGRLLGVCDAGYVVSPAVRRLLDAGRLRDYGSSLTPHVERLMADSADALLVSPFENAGYGPAATAGIPLVACADYMEDTPLGRAEWMKFYGLLFGCGDEAAERFARVESAYDSLRAAAAGAGRRPRLMTDLKMGSAWYVSGGRSYPAALYADAGADYLFARRQEHGAVPLDFETVYATAADADLWLVKYGAAADLTYARMKADFAPYAGFRPWRERKVWGCNTFAVPYYEEAPFRPDLLLRDLVGIFHPGLLPGYRPRYFTPLRE